jgi:UDP:flavonoid glycosyltransferase YjiC (YdhE family)
MKKIRYYISGHGLGHASRSCGIIAALRQRHPEIVVEVVSDAQPWFFQKTLDPAIPVRRRKMDIGVLQQDSLIMREEETLRAYREFLPERQHLVEEEAASLRQERVCLVAADIPPCAFAAARTAGIFSAGVSNFSWDWIYEGLAEKFYGYEDVLQSVRADYQAADLLLRLPFFGDFSSFRQVEPVPMVVRLGIRDPEEIRRELDIADGLKLGLISFGGFGLRDNDFRPLAELKDWVFLLEEGNALSAPNLRSFPVGVIPYPELVRAADAVITKPGYGIVSECIANGTAVLYTTRGDFREQALLVDALHRFGRAREIDNGKLRRGEWGPDLEQLLALPAPEETLAGNGAEVVADRLAELVGEVG